MFFRVFAHRLLPPFAGVPCLTRIAWGALLFGVCVSAASAQQSNQSAIRNPQLKEADRGVRAPNPIPSQISNFKSQISNPPAEVQQDEAASPLSIYESCMILNAASRLLSGKSAPAASSELKRIDRMLAAVILYVDRVDRANPTLPYYAWEEVSSQKVPKDGWETQNFKLANPVPQVTALSIHARHGDIEIKSLAAVDRNKTLWEFKQIIKVAADQPRAEICFLPLPTELAELRITCRRIDPKSQRWGRLFIDAGVSSLPESAKHAIYYLQTARGEVKLGKTLEARRHILQAYEHLRDYQKNRRF